MVISPPDRQRGHRPAAPRRARHLGPAARPGGRADRLRSRDAPAGLRLPDLPRARRRLLPRGRPAQPARCSSAAPTRASWDPHEHNFNLYTIVIGAQTLHAVGYAMGVQRDGLVGTGDPDRDAAVIAYFGDGATSQGDVNEAFIFAASYNAPVVFFCQNNQWAISEPIERQSKIPLYQRALRLRLPRCPCRRQRRARDVRRHPGRPPARPRRRRARSSSRPTPTGWARTPPPTTRPATGCPPTSSTGG